MEANTLLTQREALGVARLTRNRWALWGLWTAATVVGAALAELIERTAVRALQDWLVSWQWVHSHLADSPVVPLVGIAIAGAFVGAAQALVMLPSAARACPGSWSRSWALS